jgi:hypothetical protein
MGGNMKGLVITPSNFVNVFHEKSVFIAKTLGFKLLKVDDCDPDWIKRNRFKVVINMFRPQYYYPNSVKSLVNLDKKIKLISFFHD